VKMPVTYRYVVLKCVSEFSWHLDQRKTPKRARARRQSAPPASHMGRLDAH
jgi:hypothetical protein